MYIIERQTMKEIKQLLGSLYKGDKEGAQVSFTQALEQKRQQALDVKKVAVASDIYNKG